VTAEFGLGYYCAGPGYDEITGWGSVNMLQFAWMFNWLDAKANGAPSVSFGGPAINNWYNTDQIIDWDIDDNLGDNGGTVTGIAGYTQGWGSIPGDARSKATPGGDGDSFYTGPQHVNSSFGCTDLSGALCTGGPVSQGCHTVYVQGWNNMGVNSGIQSYGPICYDTIPPTVSASLTGTKNGAIFISSVKVTISASDSGSGVKAIYYQLNGSAVTTYTGAFTLLATGPYTLSYYAVDVAGNKSTVGSAAFSIESPTTTALVSSLNPATYGINLTLTATVADTFGGTPTGTVTFRDGATTLGTATLSAGKAALVTSAFSGGANSLTAEYDGDGYDEASTSSALTETIKQAGTATTLTSSLNPSAYGASVTLTATVKSSTTGTPAGIVTFKDGTTTLGTATLSAGKATFTTTTLTVGVHSLTASYGGSTDFLTSASAALSDTVDHAASKTTLASSKNPSSFDESVTFTAAIASTTTGTPTGTVAFKDGTTTIASAGVTAGKASFTTSTLALGGHSLTAVYSGSGQFLTSTSSVLTQDVDKAATTTAVVSSLNPSTYGKSVTFTATVTSSFGTPTGTVTFKNGSTVLGDVALSAGKAEFAISTLAVGSQSITAVYGGATDYSGSFASVTQVVDKATTTTTLVSSLNPSTSGASVTFTATVASAGGVPTGSVSFWDGATQIGTGTLSGGKATFATTTLPTGTDSIKAIYAGSTDFDTSTSAILSQKVNP
jgi:hypothetical protein